MSDILDIKSRVTASICLDPLVTPAQRFWLEVDSLAEFAESGML
jgi:hypothetical protein